MRSFFALSSHISARSKNLFFSASPAVPSFFKSFFSFFIAPLALSILMFVCPLTGWTASFENDRIENLRNATYLEYAGEFTIDSLPQQESSPSFIAKRLLLIGDAGAATEGLKKNISLALQWVIPGKSTVIFLGDNIYPRGLPPADDPRRGNAQSVLLQQLEPFSKNQVPVVFLPGNHDYDKSGKYGEIHLRELHQFLQHWNQSHSLTAAALTPYSPESPVASSLLLPELQLVFLDSEWWIQQEKDSALTFAKRQLQQILQQQDKGAILLFSHHPLKSYGNHGGKFPFKDHLFPLTAINKRLWVPLPVLGSLYPVLRKSFPSKQDLSHPKYHRFIQEVRAEVQRYQMDQPRVKVYHVSGHEHSLQWIEDGFTQIVSGSGSKSAYVQKGKGTVFASPKTGFVVLDVYNDGNMVFSFFEEGIPVPVFVGKDSLPVGTQMRSVQIRPEYAGKSNFHNFLFGKNYRTAWADSTLVPVISLRSWKGGLTPIKQGGGMQTTSLRLLDSSGKEWVLRSVEKKPEVLLPQTLRNSFATDWLDDAMSAQHPFSALAVPPLAEALGIPHAKPVIGLVAVDTSMKDQWTPLLTGRLALLEEREPLGKSDNTLEMLEELSSDHDHTLDGKIWLRAKMLDWLVGDWDRHPDQWRWKDTIVGKGKAYLPVPRDRDQVFHKTEGLFPNMVSRPWLVPTLQGFGKKNFSTRYTLYKSRFADAFLSAQLSRSDWEKEIRFFQQTLTDSLLKAAVERIPVAQHQRLNNQDHHQMYRELVRRRDLLEKEMLSFFQFRQKKIDLLLSQKREAVFFSQKGNHQVLTIQKINKDGKRRDTLLYQEYDPKITKELFVYTNGGEDEVYINDPLLIPLRLVTRTDTLKLFDQRKLVENKHSSGKKIRWYGAEGGLNVSSTRQVQSLPLKKIECKDSAHVAFQAWDGYNSWMPLISGGINIDDGLILGGGFRYTHRSGFRKSPFSHQQELIIAHSFSTSAYRIRYQGLFKDVFPGRKPTDFHLRFDSRAPDNTVNFFGKGNNTTYEKVGDHRRFYRTRFSLYTLEASLSSSKKSQTQNGWELGTQWQYYKFDADDNEGRFIEQTALIGSYDSSTINRARFHGGLWLAWKKDTRNQPRLPTKGQFLQLRASGWAGLNNASASFLQLIPEWTLYNSLSARSTILMANRIGGGVTFGKPAFYQSLFLGGQDNLLGYRQFRFAGDATLFHNVEFRFKLADLTSYLLPGQIGVSIFSDQGRVWKRGERSSRWHHGWGAGVYLMPAGLVIIQGTLGYSKEGLYPYFSIGWRF